MLKVGDRVKCHYDDNGDRYYVGKEGRVTSVKPSSYYKYGVTFASSTVRFAENELTKLEITMDNLEPGDIITRGYSYDREVKKVLDIDDETVVITADLDDGELVITSVEELKDEWEPLVPEVKEMTVAEIAAVLGHEVKIIKE